jgi:hypothetical protein
MDRGPLQLFLSLPKEKEYSKAVVLEINCIDPRKICSIHVERHYANNREPNVMSVGPNGPRAPTTVSVPPLRYQQGPGIDVHDKDMDTDEESDCGDEDEEDVNLLELCTKRHLILKIF